MSVLAVARNLVSALRLLDVLAVFVDDPRVHIHWTIVPGSDFAAETDTYLRRLGVLLTPWPEACAGEYKLIVATSGNGALERLSGALILLPHGGGYSRVVAPGAAAPAGLAPEQLVRDGRVIARVIGLEHEDQRARLAAYCPQAAPAGRVLGDPTRDRMAWGARLRGLYRAALGVPDRCALIVLSSTWGPGSLLTEHPDLPARLTASMPFDGFRLAAIVHPNMAASMGEWEVSRRLMGARKAGLRLIPADRWQSAVLAADLVLGDHGSVSLYAAAAGTRVLFGAFDAGQIVAGSPMADLAARAPRLDPRRDLAAQIGAALTQDPDGEAYRRAAGAFDILGLSLETTARVAYEILGLPPPHPAGLRAPEPVEREDDGRTAHLVLVGRDPSHQADLVVRRFAAAVDPDLLAGYEATEVNRHVAASETELDMTVRDNAEVVLLGPVSARTEKSLAAALAREPTWVGVVGAVTDPGHCLALLRGFGLIRLRADDSDVDAAVLASVLHAVVKLEQGDPGAALKRLRSGVRVLIGAATTLVTAYDAASPQP